MNKIFLIGNLTRDPELSVTTSGISVCRFSIAVTRRFASADGSRETDFLNIVAWRGIADNCGKFLKKGHKVAVCGNLQTRSYENKDGIKVNTFEIVADEVEFLTTKSQAEGMSGVSGERDETVAGLQPVEDDDLPF